MEIPEDLPREPPGYEEKTTKNDEQTEGEPQSSEEVGSYAPSANEFIDAA
jgi:hypothetical protein